MHYTVFGHFRFEGFLNYNINKYGFNGFLRAIASQDGGKRVNVSVFFLSVTIATIKSCLIPALYFI